MADPKTLEELRSKIIESMGKKDSDVKPTTTNRPNNQGTADTEDFGKKRLRSTRSTDHHNQNKRMNIQHSDTRNGNTYNSYENRNENYEKRNDSNNSNGGRYRTHYQNDNNNNRYSNNDRYNNCNENYNSTNNNNKQRYNNNTDQRYNNNNNQRYNNNNNQRYNNNQSNNNNHQRYNNNTNNRQNRTRDNQGKQKNNNAFLNVHLYKNLTHSRINSTITISNVEFSTDISAAEEENKSIPEAKFEKLVDQYCKGLGLNFELIKFKFNSSLNSIVMEFNSAECSTILLSTRSFLSRKASLKESVWSRPNGYVLQKDNMSNLCNERTIAIENIDENDLDMKDLQNSSVEYIKSIGLSLKDYEIKPLTYKEKDENEPEFTGCIVISSPLSNQNVVDEELLKDVKWFKPNDSKILKQETKSFTFNSFAKKVSAKGIPESRILLLLNCVNPLELKKDPALGREIQECLQLTLPNVESINFMKPSSDYRLAFNFIKEQAGNIYVKFQDIVSAKKAIDMFKRRKFNGRQVLHTFINEEDYINILQ